MKDFAKSDLLESDIELKLAYCPEQVAAIVRETIQKVYPHYYPSGAVQFFLDLHSEARLEKVMYSEEIYFAMAQGTITGTGSIRKNDICRLFILPEYQGKGYGSRLMDLLEARILENYPKVHVDASFPAESMYLKRGYQILRQLEDGFGEKDEYLRRLGEICDRADGYQEEKSLSDKAEVNGDLHEKVWKEAAGLRKSGKLLKRFGRISCPLVLIQGKLTHIRQRVLFVH